MFKSISPLNYKGIANQMKVVSSKLTVYIFLLIHVHFKGNKCGIFLLP